MIAHPYGGDAVLLRCRDAAEVRAWHTTIVAAALPGVRDVVPGAQSVLVRVDLEVADVGQLTLALKACEVRAAQQPAPQGKLIEIPVHYDGEDLAEVAQGIGLSVAKVIALHSQQELDVAFCGFSPGFAYLTGVASPLRIPRRVTPRPRVPTGSVAIAAGYSAIYPQPSPGGWWLLGHTDVVVWDLNRPQPALLQPGDRVRFTVASEASSA